MADCRRDLGRPGRWAGRRPMPMGRDDRRVGSDVDATSERNGDSFRVGGAASLSACRSARSMDRMAGTGADDRRHRRADSACVPGRGSGACIHGSGAGGVGRRLGTREHSILRRRDSRSVIPGRRPGSVRIPVLQGRESGAPASCSKSSSCRACRGASAVSPLRAPSRR